MKKTIRFIFLAVLVCAALMLSSCVGGCAHEYDNDQDASCNLCGEIRQLDGFKVVLSVSEGATVDGSQSVQVANGGTATFNVTIADGYVFESVDNGTYDVVNGVLTVENVTRNLSVNFTCKYVGAVAKYDFEAVKGYVYDSYQYESAQGLPEGTVVMVSANDVDRIFRGWTVGKSLEEGGTLISTDRRIDFVILGQYANANGLIKLFSNYSDADELNIALNGGLVNPESKNMKANEYYTAKYTQGKVNITYKESYLSVLPSISLFYDDGTFYRDGYVLKEYNTKADGTGEGYSLGSKYYIETSSTLYLIWEKATEQSAFTFEDYNMPLPAGTTLEKAPHWVENGVIITSYNGNYQDIVIPEYVTVNGEKKVVIAIKAGAFADVTNASSILMSRRIQKVEDGAFTGMVSLETIYFPDGLYDITNDAFDADSYSNLKNFYVNATLAPRFSKVANQGALAIKLANLLATEDDNRIILIGGSSALHGFSAEYMQDLLNNQYSVINFGTTRTTNGNIYLEAMQALAHEGDIVLYAPENSSYVFGEREVYWKTLRDMEGMYNLFRHIDISGYTNVISAFSDLNKNERYGKSATAYEDACVSEGINKYGDYTNSLRQSFVDDSKYIDTYVITLNNRVKSRFDLDWNDESQSDHNDYTDTSDETWCSIDDEYYSKSLNRAIAAAKTSGAKVMFSFCPVDGTRLVEGANTAAWLAAYEQLIATTYEFDGILGSCESYIYAHKYFYNCAFHLNDYGRTYRTYQVYLDLCSEVLNIDTPNGFITYKSYDNVCLFEENSVGTPLTPWVVGN